MYKLDLSKAIHWLQKGSLVVYPTDTLYALGADIFNEKALKQVFKIKKRPLSIPLPVAVSDFKMMKKIAIVNNTAKDLADIFLPGPLTLILKKKNCVPDLVTSGYNKVAVRIPNHDIALKLIEDFGPLTVTSANIHGKKNPEVINDIKMQLKQNVIIHYIKYGRLHGKPSTIVDLTTDDIEIIREGELTRDKILEVI